MKHDVGTADRIIRIMAGIWLLAQGALYGHLWGFVCIVPLMTGTVGWCPLCRPPHGRPRNGLSPRRGAFLPRLWSRRIRWRPGFAGSAGMPATAETEAASDDAGPVVVAR